MIRVGFVIGGYPPEQHKRRADVALSYSTPGEDRPTQMGTWPNTNLFVVTWKRKKP